MFWDKVASLYDFFENVYNGKVYKELGVSVAKYIDKSDSVLECACGTGAISKQIAVSCNQLIATDFSEEMLKQAERKCSALNNITFSKADIMRLDYADGSFDKVVAGNVIHLLDKPQEAMNELMRVCKKGGKVIIPTYVNVEKNGKANFGARFLTVIGLDFKRQFTLASYKEFFAKMNYTDVEYFLIEGRMPCAIAVIAKNA